MLTSFSCSSGVRVQVSDFKQEIAEKAEQIVLKQFPLQIDALNELLKVRRRPALDEVQVETCGDLQVIWLDSVSLLLSLSLPCQYFLH